MLANANMYKIGCYKVHGRAGNGGGRSDIQYKISRMAATVQLGEWDDQLKAQKEAVVQHQKPAEEVLPGDVGDVVVSLPPPLCSIYLNFLFLKYTSDDIDY